MTYPLKMFKLLRMLDAAPDTNGILGLTAIYKVIFLHNLIGKNILIGNYG